VCKVVILRHIRLSKIDRRGLEQKMSDLARLGRAGDDKEARDTAQ
jgi:hypothetical protein